MEYCSTVTAVMMPRGVAWCLSAEVEALEVGERWEMRGCTKAPGSHNAPLHNCTGLTARRALGFVTYVVQ